MPNTEISTTPGRRKVLARTANTLNDRPLGQDPTHQINNDGGTKQNVQDLSVQQLLGELLLETRIVRAHLELLTNEEITESDL